MKNYLFIASLVIILIANIFLAKAYNEHYDAKLNELGALQRRAGMLEYKRQVILERMRTGDTIISIARIDTGYVNNSYYLK